VALCKYEDLRKYRLELRHLVSQNSVGSLDNCSYINNLGERWIFCSLFAAAYYHIISAFSLEYLPPHQSTISSYQLELCNVTITRPVAALAGGIVDALGFGKYLRKDDRFSFQVDYLRHCNFELRL
jgi:hypothetical protein